MTLLAIGQVKVKEKVTSWNSCDCRSLLGGSAAFTPMLRLMLTLTISGAEGRNSIQSFCKYWISQSYRDHIVLFEEHISDALLIEHSLRGNMKLTLLDKLY